MPQEDGSPQGGDFPGKKQGLLMEDDSLKDSLFREKGLLRVAGLLKTEAFPGTERSLKKEGRVRSKRRVSLKTEGFLREKCSP